MSTSTKWEEFKQSVRVKKLSTSTCCRHHGCTESSIVKAGDNMSPKNIYNSKMNLSLGQCLKPSNISYEQK